MNFLVEQMCCGITPFNSKTTMCDVAERSPHLRLGRYCSLLMQGARIVAVKQITKEM